MPTAQCAQALASNRDALDGTIAQHTYLDRNKFGEMTPTRYVLQMVMNEYLLTYGPLHWSFPSLLVPQMSLSHHPLPHHHSSSVVVNILLKPSNPAKPAAMIIHPATLYEVPNLSLSSQSVLVHLLDTIP